jgi:hypothetical protein
MSGRSPSETNGNHKNKLKHPVSYENTSRCLTSKVDSILKLNPVAGDERHTKRYKKFFF